MAKISVYLNFEGDTLDAFEFYRSVFGGKFERMQKIGESPGTEALSAADREKLMHIQLSIGKNLILHGTDMVESMGHKLVAGNNFSLLIEAESKAEAEKLFMALSAGGKVDMPLQDTFWGAYYGSFTDKFGVMWQVNFDYPQAG